MDGEQDIVVHLFDFVQVEEVRYRVVGASVALAARLNRLSISSIKRGVFCQVHNNLIFFELLGRQSNA